MNNKESKIKMVVAILVQCFVLVNLVLVSKGMNPIPFSNDVLGVVLSQLLAGAVTAWNFWKNRNFTTPAQKGQEITDMIKKGITSIEQIEELIDNAKGQGAAPITQSNIINGDGAENDGPPVETDATKTININ